MQSLQIFNFNGATVRAVIVDGEPWWVAADACAILGLSGPPAQHLRRLDDDEKGVISIHTPGGMQDVAGINESGMYSLMLGSKKAEARAVKKWLTSEVMPSIRKTGSYSVTPVSETDKLAGLLSQTFPIIAGQIHTAQLTADNALAMAVAAPGAALVAMKMEQADAVLLKGRLTKRVAGLVDEALRRGFYEGNKRQDFQAVNADIRDRFGVRDGMPSDILRLALAYVDDRMAKLTSPNRLDLAPSDPHDQPA